jgi:hypothetical protein
MAIDCWLSWLRKTMPCNKQFKIGISCRCTFVSPIWCKTFVNSIKGMNEIMSLLPIQKDEHDN